jgi:hypothetical protein
MRKISATVKDRRSKPSAARVTLVRISSLSAPADYSVRRISSTV